MIPIQTHRAMMLTRTAKQYKSNSNDTMEMISREKKYCTRAFNTEENEQYAVICLKNIGFSGKYKQSKIA